MQQKTTMQKLGMTAEQYETLVFTNFMQWCESVSINDREFQKILANSAIAKWFAIEYAKCEAEFYGLTKRYYESKMVSTDDLRVCYNDCTDRINNIRPMALLQKIKKTETVSYIRVQGVKISALTFNQN